MNNNQYFEGSTPVNGNMTPISREAIGNVDTTEWEQMSTTDLHNQRSILQTRLQHAYSMGFHDMAKQIERGLHQVDSILLNRPNGDITTHVL